MTNQQKRFKDLTIMYNSISIANAQKQAKIIEMEKVISLLESDKVWLKQLVQELSSSINNGSKEGSFPRR